MGLWLWHAPGSLSAQLAPPPCPLTSSHRAGEWRDNVKSGRGIYRYKSGAAYAGEWQAGVPEGRGIRTSASGKAQSGIWKGGKLSQRTEPEECALAVATAAQAASAAKKVEVGGFSPGAALRSLLSTPALLAVGVVGAFWLAGKPLSPSVSAMVLPAGLSVGVCRAKRLDACSV